MSITATEFISRLSYRLEREAQGMEFTPETLETYLPVSLQRLGQRVAEDRSIGVKARLQKSFALTLSSGDVALSASMVTEVLPGSHLTLTGTSQPFCFIPQFQDILNPPPLSDYFFWTIHEGKIKVRKSDGTAPSGTSLVVYTNYYPLISEVPDEFVDDLIDIGVEVAKEGMVPQAVESEAEEI